MRTTRLPESIASLFDNLLLVELEWQQRCVQIPKFAVYAILDEPVFDSYLYRDNRRMGIIQQGRYQIPILDPFKGSLHKEPNHVVIICHSKGNQFGLFGYPADKVRDRVKIPVQHRMVNNIVKAFC
ncbi:hypothetical protein P2G88_01050 [Aliiglaciecola sp. CAU 1673]|uniref:hypothetical protein n=1 Tax=Aliiglaciecola sp. CAU 1673 TaxID=3032595 RepID=UPI0023D9AF8F|nr:hypothetical protein [Aliiglaciecola sp. CAU 1673]MDF2176837.1 hypothetical protein [Aliiglaciecola sp. CAU 1673]